MNKKTMLTALLIIRIFTYGQSSLSKIPGTYIYSNGYNQAKVTFGNDQTYALTSTSCLTNCKQIGAWSISSDTIKLSDPISSTGTDDCFLYYQAYSQLIYREDKLYIQNVDSIYKYKYFFVKETKTKVTGY